MKLSFEEIRSRLYEAIRARKGAGDDLGVWIEGIYDDTVIYNAGDKLFQAPYRIDDKGDAVLGDEAEVEKEVKYRPVFSVERLFTAFKESRPDGSVVRTGKVFEAGDFPDKNVQFDENDLDLAVKTFSPVDNDLEHASTILDGHLGKLQKVWKQGTELFGEVEVPAWLDQAIGEEPIKVSLAFDRNKRIVGNALVLRPRIADAAIMSAFTASQASQPTPGSGTKEQGNKPMTLKQAIKHLFGLDKVDDLDAEVTLPEGVPAAPSPTPNTPPAQTPTAPAPTFSGPGEDVEKKAMEERIKMMEAQFSAMSEQALRERSYQFADGVIRDKKAVPAQRDQIASMFSVAVRADAGSGPVFSADKGLVEGSQVEQLKKLFEAAPTHAFSGEAIPDGAALFFGSKGTGEGMDQGRKEKLLGMTGLGKSALKEAAKN